MNYNERLEAAGHVLMRDEYGHYDNFVLNYKHHNGPGCINCGDVWCRHCEDVIVPCVGKEESEKWAKQSRYELYLKLKEEFDE